MAWQKFAASHYSDKHKRWLSLLTVAYDVPNTFANKHWTRTKMCICCAMACSSLGGMVSALGKDFSAVVRSDYYGNCRVLDVVEKTF